MVLGRFSPRDVLLSLRSPGVSPDVMGLNVVSGAVCVSDILSVSPVGSYFVARDVVASFVVS